MNFTVAEKLLLQQAVELLASRTSTNADEGNVIVLPDNTHALLQKVLSPTTVVLSETLAETHVQKDVTVATAVKKVQDEMGSLTADYGNADADSYVHFVNVVGHPIVDHVVESLTTLND